MEKTNQKLGLCISGGGAKGASALAIVERLLAHGLQFDFLSGASVGALITAYYAVHGEVHTLTQKILGMKRRDWLRIADLGMLRKQTVFKGEKLRDELKSFFEDTTFESLDKKLVIPITDLQEAKTIYMQKGKIYDAMAATAAYPGVFPPHEIDKKPYADGGILDNVPYEVLFELGADKVIVINLGSFLPTTDEQYNTLVGSVLRTIDIMRAHILKIKNLENEDIFVFTPELNENLTGAFRFNKIPNYYDVGLEEFENRWSDLDGWL